MTGGGRCRPGDPVIYSISAEGGGSPLCTPVLAGRRDSRAGGRKRVNQQKEGMHIFGPPEGTNWRPPTSGNSISWDGSAVVKSFGDRPDGLARERAVLERLSGRLPVPELWPGGGEDQLRLAYIPGQPGDEAVEANRGAELLYALGAFLRKLHEIDPALLGDVLPGNGTVIVHGDFAPYNAILDQERPVIRAVLDWEAAYIGDPITDLAWCEWQFRMRHPHHGWAVSRLFEGYGSTPSAMEREEAVAKRLKELSARGLGGR